MPGIELLLVITVLLGVLITLGLVGAWALGILGSRRSTSTSPPMPVAYRQTDTTAWRRGTLRFIHDRLVLKGPGGRPVGPWQRGVLDLGTAQRVTGDEVGLPGRDAVIRVPVRHGDGDCEFALDERHYTALRAWAEASPPGWNSHVA